jgi:hypothetical protein
MNPGIPSRTHSATESDARASTAHQFWSMWISIEARLVRVAQRSNLPAVAWELALTHVMLKLLREFRAGRCRNGVALGLTLLRQELQDARRSAQYCQHLSDVGAAPRCLPYHTHRPACATFRQWLDEHWADLEPRLSPAEQSALRGTLGATTQVEIVRRIGGSARGYRTLIARAIAKIRLAIDLEVVPPPPLLWRRARLKWTQRETAPCSKKLT